MDESRHSSCAGEAKLYFLLLNAYYPRYVHIGNAALDGKGSSKDPSHGKWWLCSMMNLGMSRHIENFAMSGKAYSRNQFYHHLF